MKKLMCVLMLCVMGFVQAQKMEWEWKDEAELRTLISGPVETLESAGIKSLIFNSSTSGFEEYNLWRGKAFQHTITFYNETRETYNLYLVSFEEIFQDDDATISKHKETQIFGEDVGEGWEFKDDSNRYTTKISYDENASILRVSIHDNGIGVVFKGATNIGMMMLFMRETSQFYNLNPFNGESYINLFNMDKVNYGIKLNRGDGDITVSNDGEEERKYNVATTYFEPNKERGDNTIAEAQGMFDNCKVEIRIDPTKWNEASNAERLWVVYHEMAHDTYNIKHNEFLSLMNPKMGNITMDAFFKARVQLFNYIKTLEPMEDCSEIN